MKNFDKEDIFYFHSGDDIRTQYTKKIDVYNTEFKSELNFNNTQLKYFLKKIQDN